MTDRRYYAAAASLEMQPIDADECHRLDVVAEFHCQENGLDTFDAIEWAANKRGLIRIATKFAPADWGEPIPGIALFVTKQMQFVLGYGHRAHEGSPDALRWTDRDGFDNDLAGWERWEYDCKGVPMPRKSVA